MGGGRGGGWEEDVCRCIYIRNVYTFTIACSKIYLTHTQRYSLLLVLYLVLSTDRLPVLVPALQAIGVGEKDKLARQPSP